MHRITSRLGADGTTALGFGGDYNPEQWDRDVWSEDIRLMQEAGVNLVSLGIFSWALLEPAEGVYEFGWLDEVLDLLHAGGIRVDLANASASPPPWFSHRYPQSLPVTVDGVRLGYGSRQAFCASSVDYRRAAAALTTKIAERYANHPAVVMWHVHNEYGCHNQPCYCDASGLDFQRWLEKKYGDVDALNDAWGTAFWSQHYYHFEEITPPRRSGAFVNPTQQLDFARFSSDALLECFEAEAAILRAHSEHPVTTNFMGFNMGLSQPIDYWKWAERMDVVSNDHYLIAEDRDHHRELAMVADLTRGWAGGAPWLLMEHSTSAVNWQPRNIAKAPGELVRNSLQHVARGADAALFFQWRAAKAGAEKFHSALLPHAGTDTKIWRETVELGGILKSIAEVADSRVSGVDVAIIHDTDARWASELDSHPSIDLNCIAETRLWYEAAYRAGITADFRQSTDDLSGYKLVIVPLQYLITDAGAANITAFASAGGRVLVTYFSGIVDENDHIRLGGYPGAFRELLGVRIQEFFPLHEGETIALSAFGEGAVFSELGRADGAEVLAQFDEGPVVGSPAITRNVVGEGAAYYVATRLGPDSADELLSSIAADARIEVPFVLPADVEVVRRADGASSWLFVINHSEQEARLETAGVELISAKEVDGTLIVPAGEVAVVRQTVGP
ncbi:beta-galactosidase [Parafrigoribacterium soli]|uniref:beta-galactosidase n=1 Tax=Parafrigoribacterium soli TaxID=3144663 RepID=UPI0032EA917A